MSKDLVVRAVDVGRDNVKYIAKVTPSGGIKCALFPSVAVPKEVGAAEKESPEWGREDGDTVDIPVGGLVYTVGPDVRLAAGPLGTQMLQNDAYTTTPEYLALTLGALHYMQVDRIDLLVVGLPVATIKLTGLAQALEKRLRGSHKLGNGRTVTVHRVKTLAQPAGALMLHGFQQRRLDELSRQKNLVLDAGSRTFDWLVTDGMQQIGSRSDSTPRGMFDVRTTIAQSISRNLNEDYRDYAAIDVALRTGTPLMIFQQQYRLDRHLALARTIPQQAVAEMLASIRATGDITDVVNAGGGAFFFVDAVKAALPRHRITELRDSVFANVHGFQIAGMQIAKHPMADLADTIEAQGGPDNG